MNRMFQSAVAALICGVGIAVPVAAGPFDDGVAAYKRGDFATALRLFEPLAIQGNAEARFNLGIAFERGQGVAQDYREAVKWYRLAAEQGLAVAQFNLGLMYSNGRGVPQNDGEAVKWYRLAREILDLQHRKAAEIR
jgi:uncharacterized protein